MKRSNKPSNPFFFTRSDYKFLRGLKLATLYEEFHGKINPETKKKRIAADVADIYNPQYRDSNKEEDEIFEDTGGYFGEVGRMYRQPKKILNQYTNKKEVKEFKKWLKTLKEKGVITGSELRKYNLVKAKTPEELDTLQDNWSKIYGVKSGSTVRKIVSEFRNRFPKKD